MLSEQTSDRFCIIGAGPSGLAAAKNLKLAGIPFDCFEATNDVGGIWNPGNPYCAYNTVHLNISKKLMKFLDHAIPSEYPDFLGREQAFNYLKSYTDRFNLYENIQLDTPIQKVQKDSDTWLVWAGDEKEPRSYSGVIIANGHHSIPQMPEYKGDFSGEIIHSNDYKGPKQLDGKRVLVVGSGNSGLDIACDASFYADKSFHSMRKGYHIIPKVIFGRPTDMVFEKLKRLRLPKWAVRGIASSVMKLLIGKYDRYGLPNPKGQFFEHHPTASSRYLDILRHGKISIYPEIDRLDGNKVFFTDGRSEEIDMIVYATGYKIVLPFFEDHTASELLDTGNLFINLFNRKDESLFFVGLFQPADGGFWQLADYQSKLMTRFIVAAQNNEQSADAFRKIISNEFYDIGHGNKYTDSLRHRYEVDHYRYRQVVNKLLKELPEVKEVDQAVSSKVNELAHAS